MRERVAANEVEVANLKQAVIKIEGSIEKLRTSVTRIMIGIAVIMTALNIFLSPEQSDAMKAAMKQAIMIGIG